MAQHIAYLAGIDIAKDTLEVAIRKRDLNLTVANTSDGWNQLCDWLRTHGVGRVALEATGNYGRDVMRTLEAETFEVRQLQPKQVKAFATMRLRYAKTDRLDARLIADCAAMLEDHARAPRELRFDALADQLGYVEQIEADVTQWKTRLAHIHDARIRREITREIERLETRAAKERARLEQDVRRHADLAKRLDLLQTIQGIGPKVAMTLVIRMPELGSITREAAAALAGVAPFVHTSGRWKGETHIGGGRAPVRRALFMAAMVAATRCDGTIKQMYQRLLDKGRAKLSGLIACARKLLIYANTVLARGTPWEVKAPDAPATAAA